MRILLIVYVFVFLSIGMPIAAQFTWDTDTNCVPFRIRFAIDTSVMDVDTITSAVWDFGNNETITATSPSDTVSTIFTINQRYAVRLTVNNADRPLLRYYNGTKEALISNFESNKDSDLPDYTYTFSPSIATLKPDANYQFVWLYNQNGTNLHRVVKLVTIANPENAIDQYRFADTGNYTVELRIRESNPGYNCQSNTEKDLLVAEEFIVANVFSPKTTDYFIIDPENVNVVLSFQLFSRTGLKVFEQDAPVIYWDGRNSSGQELGTAVYFYVIEATQGDPTGDFYRKKGFIHVFR